MQRIDRRIGAGLNQGVETIKVKKMKGLIFDYGGTLDTAGDHWSYVIYDGWQKAGLKVETEEFRKAYVFAEREMARVKHVLPHHTFADMLLIKMRLELQFLCDRNLIDAKDIESKAESIARYCYQAAKESVKKAIPIIRELKKRYPIVLVSNFYGNIEAVLKDFGAADLFDNIIESAVVGVRKPDPRIFELGCEALRLTPGDVTVIGDSYSKDIEPALSIGCKAVWIKGRCWSEEEQNRIYAPTISSLSQLPPIIERGI